MTWLKRNDESIPLIHKCSLPMLERIHTVPLGLSRSGAAYRVSELVPGGPKGAVWLCDDCGSVWIVREKPTYGPNTKYGPRIIGMKLEWVRLGSFAAWLQKRKFKSATPKGDKPS